MMPNTRKPTLEESGYIRYRYKDEWEYARISFHQTDGTPARKLIAEHTIPNGAKVITCVWSKGELKARKTFTWRSKTNGPR